MIKKIVFFGSGSYTIPVVEKLLNHNLKLVITSEKEGGLTKLCESKGINYISTDLNDKNISETVQKENFDLGILASYGAYIPQNVIKSIKNGIINIHPSLLPKWKGPSPIQYTLLNSDTQTGTTLIRLDNKIDHGNILSQRNYTLNGTETTKELLDILFLQGAEMLDELIVKIKNEEKINERVQDHTKETWSYKIEKKDGEIKLEDLPKKEKIDSMIRAFYPWPTVWLKTELNGQQKLIKLLPDKKIQVEGKNVMTYKDFINGYGKEGKDLIDKLDLS